MTKSNDEDPLENTNLTQQVGSGDSKKSLYNEQVVKASPAKLCSNIVVDE